MSELTKDDADYLMKYLAIADKFDAASSYGLKDGKWQEIPDSKISLGEADRRLAALNEEYKGKIRPSTLRTGWFGSRFARNYDETENDDDTWMPSDIC